MLVYQRVSQAFKSIQSLINQYMECRNQHLPFLGFQQKILRNGKLMPQLTEPSMAPKLEGPGRRCLFLKFLLIFQPLLDGNPNTFRSPWIFCFTLDCFCKPWNDNYDDFGLEVHFHRKSDLLVPPNLCEAIFQNGTHFIRRFGRCSFSNS